MDVATRSDSDFLREVLAEIDIWLARRAAEPSTRELATLARRYRQRVDAWEASTPTRVQREALVELVQDLRKRTISASATIVPPR